MKTRSGKSSKTVEKSNHENKDLDDKKKTSDEVTDIAGSSKTIDKSNFENKDLDDKMETSDKVNALDELTNKNDDKITKIQKVIRGRLERAKYKESKLNRKNENNQLPTGASVQTSTPIYTNNPPPSEGPVNTSSPKLSTVTDPPDKTPPPTIAEQVETSSTKLSTVNNLLLIASQIEKN